MRYFDTAWSQSDLYVVILKIVELIILSQIWEKSLQSSNSTQLNICWRILSCVNVNDFYGNLIRAFLALFPLFASRCLVCADYLPVIFYSLQCFVLLLMSKTKNRNAGSGTGRNVSNFKISLLAHFDDCNVNNFMVHIFIEDLGSLSDGKGFLSFFPQKLG